MQQRQIILASVFLSVILLFSISIIVFSKVSESEEQQAETQMTPSDSVSYREILKKDLGVLETKKKRNKKRETWILGKGESIISYLLFIKKHTEANQAKVLFMEDLSKKYTEIATVDIIDKNKDSIFIELQISGEVYKDGVSKMAVVFELLTEDSLLLYRLNRLKYPHTVLVSPNLKNIETYQMLEKNEFRTQVLWLYMESVKLNAWHKNKMPIRFTTSQKETEFILKEAFLKLPKAEGVATRFGELAVENESLLRNVLTEIQTRSLYFLDLTGNSNAETKKLCKELNVLCDSYIPYNPDKRKLEEYIAKVIASARKNGSSVLVIPFNDRLANDLLENIENFAEEVALQGTEITTLKSLIELHQ